MNPPRYTTGLLLDPLDVLFFREGLPLAAGFVAESHLPTPKTLAGAIRTRLMEMEGFGPREFGRLREATIKGGSLIEALDYVGKGQWIASLRFGGPWLCGFDYGKDSVSDVFVPTPATLHKRKAGKTSELVRLDPLPTSVPLPGWVSPIDKAPGMRPLWSRERGVTEAAGGFLNLAGSKAFLDGRVPDRKDLIDRDQLLGMDRRVGIGVDVDRNCAEESLIYAASFLSLGRRSAGAHHEAIGFYADITSDSPENVEQLRNIDVVAFGGEGRRARTTVVDPVAWPDVASTDRRVCLVLTTPGLFDGNGRDGRVPAALHPESLIAGAMPGDLPVSGWDLATQGPKPTRFAAVAGSVYYLESNQQSFGDSLCSPPDDAIGWGRFMKGTWNYV